MVPATTNRRAIPRALQPLELTAAQHQLQQMRWRGVMFWLLLLPMAWVIWGVLGLTDMGVLRQLLLAFSGTVALAVGRIAWWLRQGGVRREARQVIQRWRRLPGDRRWDAAMVLLYRIERLAGGDENLRETIRRLVAVLFSLYEDIRGLDRTIAADKVLDGEGELSERYHRLVAIRTQREAQIDALLNGLRDLHLEMNEQLAEHIGPLHDRLQELMDRLEADREVAREVARVDDVRRRIQQQAARYPH